MVNIFISVARNNGDPNDATRIWISDNVHFTFGFPSEPPQAPDTPDPSESSQPGSDEFHTARQGSTDSGGPSSRHSSRPPSSRSSPEHSNYVQSGQTQASQSDLEEPKTQSKSKSNSKSRELFEEPQQAQHPEQPHFGQHQSEGARRRKSCSSSEPARAPPKRQKVVFGSFSGVETPVIRARVEQMRKAARHLHYPSDSSDGALDRSSPGLSTPGSSDLKESPSRSKSSDRGRANAPDVVVNMVKVSPEPSLPEDIAYPDLGPDRSASREHTLLNMTPPVPEESPSSSPNDVNIAEGRQGDRLSNFPTMSNGRFTESMREYARPEAQHSEPRPDPSNIDNPLDVEKCID